MEILNLFVQLWGAIAGATPEALVKAAFVLLAVFSLRLVKVLPPSSIWARATNLIMSVLLSGITTGAATQSEVALFTLTAAFSAAVWIGIEKLYALKNGKEKIFADPKVKK